MLLSILHLHTITILYNSPHLKEYEARRHLTQVGDHCLTGNNLFITSDQQKNLVPGQSSDNTVELVPFLHSGQKHQPAALVHKNSSYYNQTEMPSENQHQVPTHRKLQPVP